MKTVSLNSLLTLSLGGMAAALLAICITPASGVSAAQAQPQTVPYFDQQTATPLPVDSDDEQGMADALPVPDQKDPLAAITVWLQGGISAANVRQGPGLQYEVLGTVKNGAPLTARGRSAAGDWLQIDYQDRSGWLAAYLVEPTPSLALLAVVEPEQAAPQPPAEPVATPASGPAQPLYCQEVPIRGFGQVWADHPEIQPELGCTYTWNGGERGTNAAVQTFEHGLMIWLEADSTYSADPVYALFDDGTYQRFGDLGAADPAKVGPVPAGFLAVGDKFSKVYWEGTGARVKERLGYATGEFSSGPGAYQEFNNGRMFWLGPIDRIFVILQYTLDYQPINKYYAFKDCFELACQ